MNLTPSAWMADRLRTIPSDRLGTHTRAAGLALAAAAEVALDSPSGYTATPAGTIAPVIGLASSTTRRHLDSLVYLGLAVVSPAGGYRLPEEVFA